MFLVQKDSIYVILYMRGVVMVAVKAYYNGKAFIPLDKRVFKINQQAMIVLADEDLPNSEKKSCKGIASQYANPSLISKEQDYASKAFSEGSLWLFIDTNVILRYLLNDIPEQADKAGEVIDSGAYTLPEIVAEVVYVLVKLYSVPRDKISEIVSPIFEEVVISDKDIVLLALKIFSETKFDFVDSLLIARRELKLEDIFTFDKKLANRFKLVNDSQ